VSFEEPRVFLFLFCFLAPPYLIGRKFLYGMRGIDTRAATSTVDAVLRLFLAFCAPGSALKRVFRVMLWHQILSGGGIY
jgi:hypothetical protein